MKLHHESQDTKWIDHAEATLQKMCKDLSTESDWYEVDDISWGTDCFMIPIFRVDPLDPVESRKVDTFIFYYDKEDVFDRDIETQLNDALDEFIYMFEMRRDLNYL